MKSQENNNYSTLCSLFVELGEICHNIYKLIKSVENRLGENKRGFKGYDYKIFNIVRGLKVKKYIIMLLLCLSFVVSFNVSISASGVGNLEIEPLYEPVMTFVNDSLGSFDYNPFLRRLKTDVLENDNNFLGVDTIQSYDEVISGGEQVLTSLQGATAVLPSYCSGGYASYYDVVGTINNTYVFESINIGVVATSFVSSNNGFYIDNGKESPPQFYGYWMYTNFNGSSSLGSTITILFSSGSDLTNQYLIDFIKNNATSLTGGVYSGGETIEEKTMSLSELYSRNENFTHSNIWGVTSNYVITNVLTMGNNRGVDSLYLDYSNIVIYDEFIINYSQNNYTLIPTSIIVDISTIDNITWEWNYKVQTDIGLTEIRSQTWTLDSQYMRDNKINVLPQNPLYNVTSDQMSTFINQYGQNQFINLSSARVTINFNTNVNELDIIQYSVDKGVYNESNELAWYDFDSQGSVSNLGESLLDSANNFLQLEIFPNFRILDILLIAIAIPMLIWVLKVFFGG